MMPSKSKLDSTVTGQQGDDYVLVPRKPTPEMLYAAADCPLAEDAGAVWDAMIEEYERLGEQGKIGDG